MDTPFPDALVERDSETKIILVVLDGLGGLPHPASGLTELEAARTPNLDELAATSSLGLHIPVAPGIAPGSGPGHLALFGYDPVEYTIGRGALGALGLGFDLRPGDVAARINLATLDGDGNVTDRRAGRPSDEEGRRIVEKLRAGLQLPDGVELFLEHEKEHRVLLVLRGGGLDPRLEETDPQTTGVPPRAASPLDPAAERTSGIYSDLDRQVRELLADEDRITGLLARGWAGHARYPTFEERYGVRAAVHAKYPMYRGVAKLCGMTVEGVPADDGGAVDLLAEHFGAYDFHFIHFKDPDSRGHDGDFEGKIRAIETVDARVPRIARLGADVIVVTGDHSTPTLFGEHSWHGVPLLLHSPWARPSAERFGESACGDGDLGVIRALDILPLALAHARRLAKYGA